MTYLAHFTATLFGLMVLVLGFVIGAAIAVFWL